MCSRIIAHMEHEDALETTLGLCAVLVQGIVGGTARAHTCGMVCVLLSNLQYDGVPSDLRWVEMVSLDGRRSTKTSVLGTCTPNKDERKSTASTTCLAGSDFIFGKASLAI